MPRQLVHSILLIAVLAVTAVVLIGLPQAEVPVDSPDLAPKAAPVSEGPTAHATAEVRGTTKPDEDSSHGEPDTPVPLEPDPIHGLPSTGDEGRLIELTLHAASLDLQIERANAQLLAEAEPLWDDYWSSGQYEVVDAISAAFAMTEDGRPKPMQVKRVGKETRVLVLPEDVYPEIWSGLENLTRMTTERQTIETELTLLRESLVATGR